ncbi:xanthine dehydrogenase family protein molybdopterin-binding subunit [Mariniphaga sp.]|uniref:xanthine dehydrogenase family protein molybdopterin-binding subunit n=1 Tax=Mariniphaga sp. TaxID=1954475 RepID=UPI003562117A
MSESEIYQEYTPKSKIMIPLHRRDFFKIAGGGLYIFFQLGNPFKILSAEGEQRRSLPEDYNAFLHIAENGEVSCFTGKIEMGQGIITSLPQMMADELDVPVQNVKMVMGDTQLCPWDAGTFGSLTTRAFSPFMRRAAAEARAVLFEMAAEKLGAGVNELDVKEGVIFLKNTPGQKISYGELTSGKKIARYLDEKPDFKDYSEFKIMGKSVKHQDGIIKVTGEAKYTGDIRLPEMLYARVLRPPSHGATLTKADTSEAKKAEGVTVVEERDFIAVLHKDPEMAEKALRLIKAEYLFDEKKVDEKTIFQYLLNSNPEGNVNNSEGDLETGKTISDTIIESEFHDGYVAHATLETHTAVAQVEGEKVTAWVSTQTPFPAQESISRELRLPLENVRVITPFLGGGFGGKSPHRQGIEAARLSKITGKPVIVTWDRKEEFFYDTFRPAAVVKITSGMDKSGKLTLWNYNQYFAGARGSDTIYDVPHQKTTSYSKNGVHPFGTGAWRAPANNTNTFARESQIDMMAAKAGIDPIEFRLKNLKDPRMIAVLEALKEKTNWKPDKSPGGHGFGIACGFDAGTYVAHMAEVKVDKSTGKVQVIRVVCAQEMGYCVNPQGATIQMEGCINMGLGYALTEDIEFTGGDVKTTNFGTYEIPKFSWIPKIETVILDRNEPPQGGGEPAIICMGAVIANAIFDATGARLYQMPMTPERVLEALKKAN